ncbi:AlpA family transcriptional regulator, partial [Brenneria salicis ATCC 15712 = DSM 30166]
MSERKRFIRLPEVLERTGFCKAWIYRLISRGQFPAPIKLNNCAYYRSTFVSPGLLPGKGDAVLINCLTF